VRARLIVLLALLLPLLAGGAAQREEAPVGESDGRPIVVAS
jgi:hypothetical protein